MGVVPRILMHVAGSLFPITDFCTAHRTSQLEQAEASLANQTAKEAKGNSNSGQNGPKSPGRYSAFRISHSWSV